jgi:uncharacterized protein
MHVFNAWQSGQLKALEDVIPRTLLGEWPDLLDQLVNRRNQAWLPRIIEATKSKNRTLVCVGALHLPGRYGVLELARRAGFEWTLAV